MDKTAASDEMRCALLQPVNGGSTGRMHRASRHAYGPGARITYVDRAIIRQYFSGSRRYGPPRVFRASANAGLPQDLERSLSALEPEFARVLDGADVLLVETATRKVVDVMQNAAAGAARARAACYVTTAGTP
ncbi:MAG: hypothetical protein ABIS45_02725 [Burkholderiales bacterium]